MPGTAQEWRLSARNRRQGRGLFLVTGGLLLACLLAARPAPRATDGEALEHWRYVQALPLPPDRRDRLFDCVLPAAVFDGARADLGDLRLYDPSGKEVPYALRVRRSSSVDVAIAVSEFNRSQAPGGVAEVTLDLGADPGEHNDVEVQMPGVNYRRGGRLDGSTDGNGWRTLSEKNLLRFQVGRQTVDDRHFEYPPSRFRYLRVRVERDPLVDEHPIAIEAALVRRRTEVPGEYLDHPATVGTREAVRADGGPGSAWVLGLGGDHVPCERLAFDVPDTAFVRNYHIEAGGPASDPAERFQRIGEGVWRRAAGASRAPLVAEFPEVTAGRLKLVVTDHRNPPLNLRGATIHGAARQVVFADPGPGVTALDLYYGNPKAESPQYDFARNLPATLDPPPARRSLAERRANPTYHPAPRPFTERWPWLIYLVLIGISLGLGAIIVSLGRTAVRRHDERQAGVGAG